jgi:GMP synthase-like glutamine amidotransferase
VDELLLQDAYALRKPVLGICYGLQILNVYRHGTLLQHIESAVNHEAGRSVPIAHTVEVAKGTRLSRIVGREAEAGHDGGPSIAVNSSHHQSAEAIGQGLCIVARCPQDGIIEAIEGTSPDHFVLAVQWHPERSMEDDVAAHFRALGSSPPVIGEWMMGAMRCRFSLGNEVKRSAGINAVSLLFQPQTCRFLPAILQRAIAALSVPMPSGVSPSRPATEDAEQFSQMGSDCRSMGANFGSRQNQGRIHIDHCIASRPDALDRLRQKKGRVSAFPARIRGREKRTNIGSGDCPQQCVSNGVQKHVAIGMAAQAFRIRQGDAADLQRNAALEFVRVPAVADASFWFQGFQSGRWSVIGGHNPIASCN